MRRRLLVTLVVPDPVAGEVDVLRRALGSHDVPRIAPHITLIPPHNYNDTDVERLFDALRAWAADVAPFEVELGPAASFLPESPVLYVAVSGCNGVEEPMRFVARECAHMSLRDNFVPHVTLHRSMNADALPVVASALRHAHWQYLVRSIEVLELVEHDGHRIWQNVWSISLGQQFTVTRGADRLVCTLESMSISADTPSRGRSLFDASGYGSAAIVVRSASSVTHIPVTVAPGQIRVCDDVPEEIREVVSRAVVAMSAPAAP